MGKASLEDIKIPDEWRELAKGLKPHSTIMIIGGTDSGKTTLALFLLKELANMKPYLMDLDPGQQNIGIPTTLSSSFHDLKLKRMFFVGATTPSLCKAECICATKVLKDDLKGEMVVVDTSGMVKGPEATIYKLMKAFILMPDIIVAIEKRRGEIFQITSLLSKIFKVEVFERVPGAQDISHEERAKIRSEKLREYFKNTKLIATKGEYEEGELLGFFKGVFTSAVGLVTVRQGNMSIVKVPHWLSDWDFVLRGKTSF